MLKSAFVGVLRAVVGVLTNKPTNQLLVLAGENTQQGQQK